MDSGCSTLNLSLVNQAWFDARNLDVAVSFRFEDHKFVKKKQPKVK